MIELDIGKRTDLGRRRGNNEDYLGVFLARSSGEELRRGVLLVVADGMGGHAAGEIASRTAVDALGAAYFAESASDVSGALAWSLRRANEAVLEQAALEPDRVGMGATLAVAVVLASQLTFSNVGDCRVYLLRRGQLSQLTRDHSLVADLLATGKITAQEAEHHPMRNVVTRSVGNQPDLEVELYPSVDLEAGDTILLCSDGLSGMVPADRIGQLLNLRPAQAATDALIAEANNEGGHDNITAIACRVLGQRLQTDDLTTTQLLEEGATQPSVS